MEELNFTRQYRIFNPEDKNTDITIIGVGSTGSFTALNLAKMGIKNIKVIDFDIVESHNLPNQFYRFQDINKLKVEALQEIIKDFTGVNIETENLEVTEEYEFDVTLNTIIMLCVDSMEARKLIYNKVKDLPIKLIDTRFSSQGYSIHVVDLNNEEDKEKYEKSLKGEIKNTMCGEKSVIYTILNLASEVCNIVKRMDKGESIPTILRREMTTYRFIAGGYK
jgi:sulfur carrier protein ThiS adenylyltransferase